MLCRMLKYIDDMEAPKCCMPNASRAPSVSSQNRPPGSCSNGNCVSKLKPYPHWEIRVVGKNEWRSKKHP